MQWLEVFSATLPAITRARRSRPGTSRTTRRCAGPAATSGGPCSRAPSSKGWAHYAEELCVEEGFPGRRPRFAFGVWLEAWSG